MKEDKIKVLKIEPKKAPYVKEIENNAIALQVEVIGNFECLYLDDNSIAIVNESGKLRGMEANRRIGTDIICGPFIICDENADAQFISLSEDKIEKYTQLFDDF